MRRVKEWASRWILAALCMTAMTGMATASTKVATLPAHVTAAPLVTVIAGTPLEVHAGDDNSFQVFNSNVPGSGQIYPSGATDTADMGWFVRTADTLYAPNFSEHSSTATSGIGDSTAFTPGALSGVTGSGTAADPFVVSVASTLGASGLAATQQIRYINGNSYFTKTFTLTNSGPAQALKIFLGADIYLADNDDGSPSLQSASTSPGGQTCAGVTPVYNILLIPQTPPDAYSANQYANIWNQIGAAQLDSAILAEDCIDDGAALQWNRTIESGASVSISAAVSFGDIPAFAQFNVTAVTPASGAAGDTIDVTISGIGFQPGTTFDFGVDIGISNLLIVDANTATATLTIAPAAIAGPRDVGGTQTAGGLVATLPNGFTVTGGTAPPFSVTAVAPDSGYQGDTVNVTISGSGFQADTTFAFEYEGGDIGIPPPSDPDIVVSNIVVIDANTATATLSIAPAARISTYTAIGVQSPENGVRSTLAQAFTVLGSTVPPGGDVVATPVLGQFGLLALILGFVVLVSRRMFGQRV